MSASGSAPQGSKHLRLGTLAWPIFIEQGLRFLIGTVDTLMVSHISDGAVAALGVAMQVVILSIIAFNFIGIGSSVIITHHLGGGDRAGADRIARAAIAVNTWVGLLVSIAVAAFAAPVLELMQLPASLMPYARPFLTLMGGTLFLEAQNIAMAGALRAHGHTKQVMLTTGLQNVVNVVVNAIVLFGLFGLPKLGVPGVALSGVISRLVCFFILRHLLGKHTGVLLRLREYFALQLEPVRRVLHIGLPAAGENLSYWLAFMVSMSFVSRMGETSLAAYSYSRQVTIWVFLFTISIGLGTEILIGHLIGAGDLERAHQELLTSLKKGFALAALVSGVLALAAPLTIRYFSHDPAVLEQAITLQRLGILLETGRVFNVVVVNGLRATGDARFPLLMGAWSMWGVWVPLAWLLGLHFQMGVSGVCLAMIADEWLRGMLNFARWKRRAWIKSAELSRARVGVVLAEERPEPAG